MRSISTGADGRTPNGGPLHGVPPHASSAEEVARRLAVDVRQGLDEEEASRRLRDHGPNELEEAPAASRWIRFAAQFREVVVWILFVAAGIAAVLGDYVDAVVILSIIVVNAVLGFVQEERAARALEGLRTLVVPQARVVRGGAPRTIPARELAPGDLVEIASGDRIPADARLVQASALRCQEAVLTGESTPVSKDADVVLHPAAELGDRRSMVYAGTVVSGGRGRAVVTATGMRTELGAIAGLLERTVSPPTPLQRRLAGLGRLLVGVSVVVVAVVMVLLLLRGGDPGEVLLLALSLAVAAVPEGLTAVVTLTLALGLQRMVRQNVLVRHLPSVETLGSVSVICTDKTGTLTRNEMTVRDLRVAGARYAVSGAGYRPQGAFRRRDTGNAEFPVEPVPGDDLHRALEIGVRCNAAALVPGGKTGDAWTVVGDPLEGALLVAARKAGIDDPPEGAHVVFEIPFDAERRMMSVARRGEGGRVVLYAKGAPEAILARCTSERRGGAVVPLDDRRRRALHDEASAMAGEALKVLGLADREGADADSLRDEAGLVFSGLVGMLDPPRDEAAEAVRRCKAAGIRPVMVTGDHPGTAAAIASQVGLSEGEPPITGSELERLSDASLEEACSRASVFARVTAEHKLRIVGALQRRGETVGMTGDGVNDAPALQEADIGIAMGVSGTDITRAAADMVILDDNFASIVSAVGEGRRIFDNIQKSIHYLLATNAGEVLLMLAAAVLGWQTPLLATQILWINLVTDGFPALALGVDPSDRGVMARAPRERLTPFITRPQAARLLATGGLVAACAAIGFHLTLAGAEARLDEARTVAFSTCAFAQILLSLVFRSEGRTLPELGLFSNRALQGAVVLAAGLQALAVAVPAAREIFHVAPLDASTWLLVALLAAAPATLIEGVKLVRRWRTRRVAFHVP
jgi:Ca2+-transporting ATPase